MPDMTYRDAIALALREGLQRNQNVYLMGEDIGAYGGSYVVTKGFLDEFGEQRVRDTPISESAIVGLAIGSAMGGLKPIVELMTINFSLLAIDQIVNHAAKILYMSGGQVNVPIVLRMVTGGGSQLAGSAELCRQVTGMPTRLGSPRNVAGVAEAVLLHTGEVGVTRPWDSEHRL